MRQNLGLTFVLLVAVGAGAWYLLHPTPERNALRVRALATRGLADYLGRTHAGEQALILSNPFTQRPGIPKEVLAAEQAGVRGLHEGWGSRLTVTAVVFPELRPDALRDPRALLGDAETSTPLSYLMGPEAIDNLTKKYPACQLVVSLIGLPKDLDQCAAWTATGSPRFALLWPDLRVVGDTAAVQKAIKSGKLAACVLRRPEAPADAAPLNLAWAAEFERRFVLVTPENVDQILQRYPGLFERGGP